MQILLMIALFLFNACSLQGTFATITAAPTRTNTTMPNPENTKPCYETPNAPSNIGMRTALCVASPVTCPTVAVLGCLRGIYEAVRDCHCMCPIAPPIICTCILAGGGCKGASENVASLVCFILNNKEIPTLLQPKPVKPFEGPCSECREYIRSR